MSGEAAPKRADGRPHRAGAYGRAGRARPVNERWWEDDEELLSVVLDALREDRAVPARMIEAGKASFTWRSADEELATLTYDSLTATGAEGTRSERATIREVTFAARAVTIQV